MARQIALLRGINLGSTRRVGMADLRALLADVGFDDVRTLLQSGNVVLTGTGSGARLERQIERAIADTLELDVEVVVRTRAQLAAVVDRNPLGEVADDPKRHLVTFLRDKPKAAIARELEAADVAPEQFAIGGREIYTWHPNGIQKSPLMKVLGRQPLGTATNRNWSTVTKLLALADE